VCDRAGLQVGPDGFSYRCGGLRAVKEQAGGFIHGANASVLTDARRPGRCKE